MWDEQNTGTNLPAQIELYATPGDTYKLLFMAKGGGSANKSYLYQETKAVLNRSAMLRFLDEKLRTLGTVRLPAVPPRGRDRRHVGGVRAEDGEVRVGALPRLAADHGLRERARLPRPRARAGRARPHPGLRHRRAVRRQVLLPRRAGGATAAPRRLLPGRRRGVLLGRPAGARQDHRRRRVPRAARGGPGAATCPRSPTTTSPTTTSSASTSTGRWTRSAPSSRATR